MWLDSKAVNCPQKWGNFRRARWGKLETAMTTSSRKVVVVNPCWLSQQPAGALYHLG